MVSQWLAGYEAAWLAPGTAGLAGLFTADATYLQSPYEQPVTGLDAITRMWDEQREGPGEVFTLATEILAVDGPTAVGPGCLPTSARSVSPAPSSSVRSRTKTL